MDFYRFREIDRLSKDQNIMKLLNNDTLAVIDDINEKPVNEKKGKRKKEHKFQVEPFSPKDWSTEQPKNSHLLWPHPANSLFCGVVRSGKTSAISYFLRDKQFYGGDRSKGQEPFYDQVFLFSESPDPTLLESIPQLKGWEKKDGTDRQVVFRDLNTAPKEIERLLTEMEEDVKRHRRSRAKKNLFIFDDCISQKRFWNSHATRRAFFTNRHYGLTLITAVQQFHSLPRAERLQCSHIFVFKGINQRELESLYQTYCPHYYDKKQFYRLFNSVLDKPYSFLIINRYVNPWLMFRDQTLGVVFLPEHADRVRKEIALLENKKT